MIHQHQDDLFRKHLQSTSKEKLINRLLEFASDHYRKTIELIYASPEEKQVDFISVRKEIKELDIIIANEKKYTKTQIEPWPTYPMSA